MEWKGSTLTKLVGVYLLEVTCYYYVSMSTLHKSALTTADCRQFKYYASTSSRLKVSKIRMRVNNAGAYYAMLHHQFPWLGPNALC